MRILDPPDGPEDEEAEYQAWKERVLRRQEESRQRWASREGLIRLSLRPQAEARTALKRSLPTFRDASHLFDLVLQRLGDRAEIDVWAAPGERCLLLHDPERPGWLLPQRFLYLRAFPPGPATSPVIPMTFHGAERLRRFAERLGEEQGAMLPPPEEDAPVVLGGGQPGTIQIHEGAAHYDITWGPDGALQECCCTSGDTIAFADGHEQPFTIDPFARPAQVPPISLLLRPDLHSEGVALDTLADMVVAMRPLECHLGRVRVPCPQPGTVMGTWARALDAVRRAEWEGDLPDGPAWIVADGWNGTAIATGPSFEAAFDAWREEVERVQPLPPTSQPAPPPPEEARAEGPAEDSDGEPSTEEPPTEEPPTEEPPTEEPVRLPPPLPDDVAFASSGPIEIRIEPPVKMDWPLPRPENVAAAALFLPSVPEVPPALAAHGFDRVLRLFGEHGEVGFTFLRQEPDGYTAVGDDAVAAVDPASLAADLDALKARQDEEFRDLMALSQSGPRPDYPVAILHCAAWDDLGRTPELKASSLGKQAELSPRSWQLGHRHQVVRVWVRGAPRPR